MSNLNKIAAVIDEILNGQRRSIAAQESAALGSELIDGTAWTLGAGWSGTLAGGFTHTAGNIAPLTRAMPATGTKKYQIEFDVNAAVSVDEILVSIGNSLPFDMYFGGTHITCGITSISNGDLVITPAIGSTKVITNLSVKEITGISVATKNILDSTGNTTNEVRGLKSVLRNLFIGKDSGQFNTTGLMNTAIGNAAMCKNTTGFINVAIGVDALNANTVGSRNIAVGYATLIRNISGHRNQAIGSFTLQNNTTGNKNTAIGSDVMNNNATGSFNVAVGFSSLYGNVSGEYNTGIGMNSLASCVVGNRNVGIGYFAMGGASVGNDNLAIGNQTCFKTTGNNNTGIGALALYQNGAGSENVAIGFYSAKGSAAGDYTGNVCIGTYAGQSLKGGGNYNTYLGHNAGSGATFTNAPGTDTNGILIGYNANRSVPYATSLTNYCAIGYAALVDKSNQFVFGNANITEHLFRAGNIITPGASTFADNAAAVTGGLVPGTHYKTATGELRIVI